MINVQNLAVLLRALRQGEPSPRATSSARPVTSVLPVVALATEDGSAPALRAAPEHLSNANFQWRTTDAQSGAAGATGASSSHGAAEASLRTSPGSSAGRAAIFPAPPSSNLGATIALSPGAALLGEALRPDAARGTPVVRASRPLLTAPPGDTGDLAEALRNSVARSGLFYESHLSEWAANRYPGAELAHEPQAGWPSAPAATEPRGDDPASDGAAWRETAVPLVRQQLDTLEAGRVLWSGQVWPGQPATIELVDRHHTEERAAAQCKEPSSTGRTRIELALPSLGRVVAVMAIDGQLVTCRITAGSTAAVERLAAAGPALADALDARELVLASCAIDHEHTR